MCMVTNKWIYAETALAKAKKKYVPNVPYMLACIGLMKMLVEDLVLRNKE